MFNSSVPTVWPTVMGFQKIIGPYLQDHIQMYELRKDSDSSFELWHCTCYACYYEPTYSVSISSKVKYSKYFWKIESGLILESYILNSRSTYQAFTFTRSNFHAINLIRHVPSSLYAICIKLFNTYATYLILHIS